jgi:hypothetical protein
MFNNYNLEPEFMMDYNAKKGIYEKALLIKQGLRITNMSLLTIKV